MEHEHEHIVRRAVRGPSHRVLSCKVDTELCGLADLEVDVASEVEAVVGEVAVVLRLRVLLEHTVFLLITGRDKILCIF